MVVLNEDQMVALRKARAAVKDEQTQYLLAQVIKICTSQRAEQGIFTMTTKASE
jgi:hypothetical protein